MRTQQLQDVVASEKWTPSSPSFSQEEQPVNLTDMTTISSPAFIDNINREIINRLHSLDSQTLLRWKQLEEERLATLLQEKLRQEVELLAGSQQEKARMLRVRRADLLAICGAVSGILAGSSVLVYALNVASVIWASIAMALLAFVVAVTSAQAHQAHQFAIPYFNARNMLRPREAVPPIHWQRQQEPLALLWEVLTAYPRLNHIAEMHSGLQWNKPSDTAPSDSPTSEKERTGFALGLYKVDITVESYIAEPLLYLDVRPEHHNRDDLRWEWQKPKALVNVSAMNRSLWRVFAIADTEGLYASSDYIGVWPRLQYPSSISIEVLSAVLNGPLANVFIYQHGKSHNNDIRIVKQLPVPTLTKEQIKEITEAVDAYVNLRWENTNTPGPWTGALAECARRALVKIDAAVMDAYALPPDLESLLLRQFDGIERRHLPFTFTGYDPAEWASVKAELADDREGQRIADAFSALLTKSNLSGLSEEEQAEYDRLQAERTARRMRYHELTASDK